MLLAGTVAEAVVAAIRELNSGVRVVNRGAYLSVLVPRRCVVTRELVEAHLGRPFRLPGDLEAVMPALRGVLAVSDESATWSTAAGTGSLSPGT